MKLRVGPFEGFELFSKEKHDFKHENCQTMNYNNGQVLVDN